MSINQVKRPSESPFANDITHSLTTDKGKLYVMPDGRWDLMIVWSKGKTNVIVMNGPMLQAAHIPYEGEAEMLVITFDPSTYMISDRFFNKGMHNLPVLGNHAMKIGSDVIEIPTFDNADIFIQHLYHRGILGQDNVVTDVLNSASLSISDRTKQRHFLQVTGMTHDYYTQIQRAQKAYDLLCQGERAIDVAYDMGFSDQFHLSKSLKKILGQTPTQIQKTLQK